MTDTAETDSNRQPGAARLRRLAETGPPRSPTCSPPTWSGASRATPSASKDYREPPQFIDEVLAPFGARFSTASLPPGQRPLDPRRRRHRRRPLGRPRHRQRRPALREQLRLVHAPARRQGRRRHRLLRQHLVQRPLESRAAANLTTRIGAVVATGAYKPCRPSSTTWLVGGQAPTPTSSTPTSSGSPLAPDAWVACQCDSG